MTSIEHAPTPVPTPPHRLAILDDHELIVDGLARWFTDFASDFTVVIRATSWMDLVRDPEFPVDLVLMDLQLGDTVSIESRIRACRAAGAKVVVVTAIDDDESRRRSLVAGAAGFVSKTLPADQLVDYARRVMNGERLPRHPAAASRTDAAGAGDVVDHHGVALSAAEEKALRYYAQGLSTVEVGRRMEVGYETAKTYLRRVREKYAKAGRPASRKAELIRRAAEDGYLE
ncbi:hypothetical protein ASE14_06235 [Agromyces sp. Root81]|uniref:response regulator transcription factor n=1 Tax=Agromyces sp. Root81 TaxID=1736601 RepID=UPI00070183FD|nr:response regulator transcription factor [Agromyces sp. Root81]KRC60591.1 hypothetical protein ASE14_06235 [Agromyces sp. Root81]